MRFVRYVIGAIALGAAAILGSSLYVRVFGAYGYTPRADDAIALALVALVVYVLFGEK